MKNQFLPLIDWFSRHFVLVGSQLKPINWTNTPTMYIIVIDNLENRMKACFPSDLLFLGNSIKILGKLISNKIHIIFPEGIWKINQRNAQPSQFLSLSVAAVGIQSTTTPTPTPFDENLIFSPNLITNHNTLPNIYFPCVSRTLKGKLISKIERVETCESLQDTN